MSAALVYEAAALAFLFGLLIGSFLNVCVYRLPRDLSVMRPSRSFCPHCEKTIAWYDNIPVLSYLFLGGRCRFCRERIPLRYLLVELSTGIAFGLCVAALGLTTAALKYCLFSAILIALIATDLEERILPDEFTKGGIVLGLVLAFFVPLDAGLMSFVLPYSLGRAWTSVAEAAFGAVFSGGTVWLLGWAYQKVRHREGMGLGDVKMIAMVGAFLGIQGALLTMFVGSAVGSIFGLIYIYATHKDASTYELPFGSFLGASALLLAMIGDVMVKWLGH
jgi:leader peptidase (prepilin peptidase)/N-methyltransferase